MSKWKWKMAFVLILMVSAVIVSACGRQAQSETASATAAADRTSAGAGNGTGPVEIEFWYGLGGKLGENMQRMIEKFNASQDEVIVKGVAQGNYDETEQKLQAAIAAGNVPAAVLASNHEWAKKGLFAPLDAFIETDPEFRADDFVPAFLEQGRVDGKQYFLPMYGTTQVLYYRKDMLEQAGIRPEQLNTWEGLAEAAAKMTVRDGDDVVVYGWEPMWGSGNMIDSALSRGAKILSDDGRTVLIDSPEWIDTWEAFRKWIHEDNIMRIHHGGTGWEYWYKTIDDVMQGRAAGYTGSSGDQGDLDFSIVAAWPQPAWEGHEARPVASALLAGIPAGASPGQQQAAYKWLTFFSKTENTAEWSINTGYIAVRNSALDDPAYKAFSEANPQIKVPLMQAGTASSPFIDPTGGKISDALSIAADKVQIENIPAEIALKEAKETAQRELDRALGAK